jgi:DNA-binding MarR family transcriptional regulator
VASATAASAAVRLDTGSDTRLLLDLRRRLDRLEPLDDVGFRHRHHVLSRDVVVDGDLHAIDRQIAHVSQEARTREPLPRRCWMVLDLAGRPDRLAGHGPCESSGQPVAAGGWGWCFRRRGTPRLAAACLEPPPFECCCRLRHEPSAGAAGDVGPLSASGRRACAVTGVAASLADRVHSAAIHLLRRLRRTDPLTGVHPAQLSVLSVLMGGPRTLGDLAAAEQVQPPTMSRLIRDMEAAGLVARRRDDADGRVVWIGWTSAGEAVLRRGRELRIAALRNQIDALPPADQQALLAGLEVIERVVRAL